MKVKHRIEEFSFTRLSQSKLTILLLAFLLMFIVQPFVVISSDSFTHDLMYTIIILSALYAASSYRKATLVVGVFALISLIFQWSPHVYASNYSLCGAYIFGLCALFGVLGILQALVLKSRKITYDTIAGAIIVYLLIGYIAGVGFSFLEFAQPGSFDFSTLESVDNSGIVDGETLGEKISQPLIYYSYITLTTIGYGDIIPISKAARSFSIFLAVVGQMYMTILMGILVGVFINSHMKQRLSDAIKSKVSSDDLYGSDESQEE